MVRTPRSQDPRNYPKVAVVGRATGSNIRKVARILGGFTASIFVARLCLATLSVAQMRPIPGPHTSRPASSTRQRAPGCFRRAIGARSVTTAQRQTAGP